MRRLRAFTLIELLVVLAIIATLLTIAVPRYFNSLDVSKETALRQSLAVMREAIDHHYGDLGKYPDNLQDLVTRRYLRSVPVDPLTGLSDSWVAVAPGEAGKGNLRDIKSGAPGNAKDGTPYATW
ncbi:MAG: type II secretion system protein [Dechloromonas sp.]|nr:type II secretion system protein [Dechloromonas sp.]